MGMTADPRAFPKTPAVDAAYEVWDRAWAACVKLKKKHQPNASPIEEWAPLEQACTEAALALRTAVKRAREERVEWV